MQYAAAKMIEMDVSSKSFLPPQQLLKGSHRPEWDDLTLNLAGEYEAEVDEEKRIVTTALDDYEDVQIFATVLIGSE